MSITTKPALWLLIIIVGLPMLSETIYTPALPDIGQALMTSDKMMEFTLSIYLAAFALGTFLWGNISDRLGRRPCLLTGISIYLIGCVLCYLSSSIEMLLVSRFVQGFGGSAGSVLGQAISRESFDGSERGRVFSTIGSSLALAPIIGPTIGGLMDQWLGWSSIFALLVLVGAFVLVMIISNLPETHHHRTERQGIMKVAKTMTIDKRVIGFCLLVGLSNGLFFSYYSEGPFYLQEILGLTQSQYGLSFMIVAVVGMQGALLSRHLLKTQTTEQVLIKGLWIKLAATVVFASLTMLFQKLAVANLAQIILTLGSMAVLMLGMGMLISNCLAMALGSYQKMIGTASSIFGLSYYALSSFCTVVMSELHNDTLLPMPLYFMGMTVIMMATYYVLIRRQREEIIA